MNKKLLFFLITLVSITGYSQITFEKGYYISNTGETTDCLIKNMDWKNNPAIFEYKTTENGEVKTLTMRTVKEFGIGNTVKYIRKTVNIDKASEKVSSLSLNRAPEFEEEQHFLKVLVEGKANLYLYENASLRRFFYNKVKDSIKQLVYKKYKTTDGKIGKNNYYKQQLLNDLECSTITMDKIEKVSYKIKSLINFFKTYNSCTNSDFTVYENLEQRDLFNLSVRPRINSSSLTSDNSLSDSRDGDYGSETTFGLGIELEYILPFNKNKWSVIAEPTYQYFKVEKITDVNNVSGGQLFSKIDYKSIEIPIGIRHYFFLNQNSKIFINASYVIDVAMDSTIEFNRADGSNLSFLEIDSRNNFAFGIGYKLLDAYSVELRYQTGRNILGNYIFYNSEYKTVSFILGYSFF